MSAGDRIPYAEGLRIFGNLAARLDPVVSRISVAGSLRRKCETVGDVEIVCIPKAQADLFGQQFYTDAAIKEMLSTCGYSPEYRKDGPLYKQFVWQGVVVDLFITTPPQWGLILALRTGPAEWSHKLVTKRRQGGLCPGWMDIRDGRLWKDDDQVIDTPEESDVFKAMGLEWVDPEARK